MVNQNDRATRDIFLRAQSGNPTRASSYAGFWELSWVQLSEQIFRIDKWSICRGYPAKQREVVALLLLSKEGDDFFSIVA
jgi:hypothetical protein